MEIILAICVLGGLFTGLAGGLVVAERFLVNYGICQIDINAGERPLEVEGGQTLLSALYEEEVFNVTKNLSVIIEPVLMLLIGAAIGFFAISMIQPIYSMIGAL